MDIRLERFTEEDRELYDSLVFNEKVMKMDLGRVFTEEEADMFFRSVLLLSEGDPSLGYFRAYDRDTDDFIGMCSLLINDETGAFEIEYMLLPEYWGKGYGTFLVRTLVAMAAAKKPNMPVTAITDPSNLGSRRILEKNGFVLKESFINDDGDPAELYILII